MYAPFGAGVLVGPRATFADGDPFLAGGGAVDLVDLDEVAWTDPPEREEAGSPNVLGAVALHAAIDELGRIGWDRHRRARRRSSPVGLRAGLAAIDGVRLLGPGPDASPTLPLAAFTVDGYPPRPGGGPAERRVRDRRAPRLLLRPPLPDAPPRPLRRGDRRLPPRGPRSATAANARRGAGQRRASTRATGRHRPAPRRRGRHRRAARRRPSATTRTRDRRLLARRRRSPDGAPPTGRSARPAPGADGSSPSGSRKPGQTAPLLGVLQLPGTPAALKAQLPGTPRRPERPPP